MIASIQSSNGKSFHSLDLITNPHQILANNLFQFCAFGKLFGKFGRECVHLFIKGYTIIFDFFCANIAPRHQHVVIVLYLFNRSRFAETGFIFVLAVFAAPVMVRLGNELDIAVEARFACFVVRPVVEWIRRGEIDFNRLAAEYAEFARSVTSWLRPRRAMLFWA